MILVDNINYLRQHNRAIRELLIHIEEKINDEPIEIVTTKSGFSTIQVSIENRNQLIHSKYDPIREAETFIEQFSEKVDQYEHVFFYGVGLGYHVEAFLKKYPNLSFTLYEPNPFIFYHYVSQNNLNDLPLDRLKYIHVEKNDLDMKQFIQQFSNQLNEKVLLVSLPSYENIFQKQYKKFFSFFKELIIHKKTGFHTNLAFEKRWTINSLMNLPTTIQTPNILHDFDKSKFKGKPALIVAAGPSLAEEIENLRFIKENGLAYIFSVGSAINALVEYGIYPHAACTYDPKERNQLVFKKVVDKGIDTIPLIYGSSVGFETLQKYLGPKIHMLTSQDTISRYYLKHENFMEIDYVNDAPSIAVVTLQLLYKLGFNPIILVGQNLAYKDNRKFSKGIEYSHISSVVNEQQLKNALKVESVDGKMILTDDGYNRMRIQMEEYIKTFVNVNVINTTKGGAKIQGTKFKILDEVISEDLSENVVSPDWYKDYHKNYKLDKIKEKQKELDKELNELKSIMKRLANLIHKLEKLVEFKQENELHKLFRKIDKEFKKFQSNYFYKMIIAPMVRVEFEIAAKNIQNIRFERDVFLKGKEIKNIFGTFIYECNKTLGIIEPLYENVKKEIESISE